MKLQHRLHMTVPFRSSGLCFEVEGQELLDLRASADTPLKAQSFSRFRRWAGLRFDSPLEAGCALDIELDVLGSPETVLLVPQSRIRWISAPVEPQLLKEAEMPADEVLVSLCKRSDEAAGDRIKELGREYFSRLDRRTNPEVALLEPEFVGLIRRLFDILKQRVLLRQRAIENSATINKLPAFAMEAVKQISALIIGVLESSFGSPLEEPDRLEIVGQAHDVFAWGGLYLRETPRGIRIPNTAPDGAAIFLFPELAHLALENQIDVENWLAMLPILTRMPALYLRVHALHNAASVPRSFADYGFPPKIEVAQSELQAYSRELAQMYDKLTPNALGTELGRLANEAFGKPR